ncbi:MAG TPA: hypothetical protein VFK79_10260 [Xanthobacteraceae bacterium]|nr:hypothetical protein [Xanthobacteraceae bacterium]
MRTVVSLAGILLLLLGLLWIGQGTGYFPYPSYSFMVSEMTWAYRGAGVALAGIIVILLARRIGR